MKFFSFALLLFVCSVGMLSAQKSISLKTQKDTLSYSLGANFAATLKAQSIEADPDIVVRGFRDTYSGGKTLLTNEEVSRGISELQNQMMAKRHQEAKVLGEKNRKEGEAFLAANKKKEGVVTLPSGLQYKILKAGTGPIPTADQTIVANYSGTLLDGKEFDSSYKRGTPLTIPMKSLIKGWTEALQLMPVGSKWRLFIPSQLAYGIQGQGEIGPNATLIFDLELLSIQ